MNILVTGGAGYIGSIIVEQLLERGENGQVIVLDNLVQGHREAVADGALFIQGDIGDIKVGAVREPPPPLEEIMERYEIEAVIHMAAETVVERSMTDPKSFFHENIVKGIALLDAMLEHGIDKLIFSSSAAVYGEPQTIPITEDHPKQPVNAYGESKLMFERILDWYHRAYGLKYIALRYFNAAGASERFGEDHDPESHLIPLVLKTALRQQGSGGAEGQGSRGAREQGSRGAEEQGSRGAGEQGSRGAEGQGRRGAEGQGRKLRVFGNDYPTRDGTCVRDYIHVVDLAQAHILALENLDRYPNGRYNLGNGQGFTVLEVIEAAKRVTGIDISYEFAPRRPGDPAVLVASPERAKRELGWEPKFAELEAIVESAWRWHQSHPDGYGT